MAVKRIGKELKNLGKDPIPGMSANPAGDGQDLFAWTGFMNGPEGTPYEGGVFFFEVKFPQNYPFKPPAFHFTTQMWHCNVNDKGHICLGSLQSEWSPALTISKVLMQVKSKIMNPDPDDPLNNDAAQQYVADRVAFNKKARDWTKKHAC